ncbi:MAG: hypothetical protein AAGD14_08485 [Planctomycetota bacterium]
MQRMLVFIVIALVAGVVGLGLMVSDIADTLEQDRLARAREEKDASRDVPERDESTRIAALEAKLQSERESNTKLRRELGKLDRRVSELAGMIARRATSGSNMPPPPANIDGPRANGGAAPTRARDENGNFVISDEEKEYVRAIQASIDRDRRITGQTRNYMRRIDSLVRRQEVKELDDETKEKVEKTLARYVTLNDDLVTAYVRNPGPEAAMLSDDERREHLREQRQKFGDQAKTALEPLLGSEDTAKIAERVFTNPWGLRPSRFNNR